MPVPPVPGIDNFHRVDEPVYRGAQPLEEGFEYLAKVGVKTVMDLRNGKERTSAEEKEPNCAWDAFRQCSHDGPHTANRRRDH